MTTETTDTEEQNLPAENDQSTDAFANSGGQDEDADMAAAFAEVTGQPAIAASVDEGGDEAAKEAAPGESTAAEATEESPELDAATDALRKAEAAQEAYEKLGKSNATLTGLVGTLKQQVESLRAGMATKAAPISKEAFKRLSTEFGDDFADAIVEGLNATQHAQGIDPDKLMEQLDAKVAERLEKRDREAIPRILNREHKDWGAVVNSPEWEAYTESLPEDARTKLANTWDAYEIADAITSFKEHKAEAEKVKARKVVKLQRAMAPQGPGTSGKAPPMTEEQAMQAAYKAARG